MNTPYTEKGKRGKMYNWFNYQRQRRKALPHRYQRSRRMTPEEIEALDAIGFDWQPGASPEPPVRSSSTTKVPATAVDVKMKRIFSDDVRPTANARGKINSARHSPSLSPNERKPAVKSKAGNTKLLAEKPRAGEQLYVY